MPNYYFHVKRGQMTVLDQDGVVLPDIAEAEREAARRASSIILCEGLKAQGVIVIADDAWQTLMEVGFQMLVT